MNQTTREGYTPLTLCIAKNNLELMKMLLDRPDLEKHRKKNNRNGSPYHQACLLQAVKALDLLIAQKVSPL